MLAEEIFKIMVKPGQQVIAGEVLLILEAMKMETEVRASCAGKVSEILVTEGDSVQLGTALLTIS